MRVVLLAALVALCGCSATQSIEAAKTALGGGSGMSSEDQALETKLAPFIECINRTDASLRKSSQAFFTDAIPTPGQFVLSTMSSFKIEVYERDNGYSRACIAGLRKGTVAPPKIARLDAAGASYATQLDHLLPTLNAVDTYYDEKNFKDDHYARARAYLKQLHPAFAALFRQSDVMRAVVEQQNQTLKLHELAAIEKTEGRKRRWHTVNVMIAARRLFNAGDRIGITAKALTAPLRDYQVTYEAAKQYADTHQAEAMSNDNASVMDMRKDGGWFYVGSSAQSFLTAGKELQRGLPGATTMSDRQSLFQSFESSFNALVSSYNQAVAIMKPTQ